MISILPMMRMNTLPYEIITRLAEAGFKIGPKKCKMTQHKLNFLDFEIAERVKGVLSEYLRDHGKTPT